MKYRITDLIEPDNGCEGFMPGEEPMVTLTLVSEDNGTERRVRMPDILAYRLKWDVGVEVTDDEVEKYCVS